MNSEMDTEQQQVPQSEAEYNLSVFDDPISPDLTIHCDDKVFHVHRDIICKDYYLAAAYNAATFWEEDNEPKIVIHGVSKDAVRAALHFVYYGNYDNLIGGDQQKLEDIVTNVDISVLAHKWHMKNLRREAYTKIRDWFRAWADKTEASLLLVQAAKTASEFLEPNSSERAIFAFTIRKHEKLILRDAPTREEILEMILEEAPALLNDLATMNFYF